MDEKEKLLAILRERAKLVATKVIDVSSLEDAFDYTLKICEQKEPCLILPSFEGEITSYYSPERIIVAPNLSDEEYTTLSNVCKQRDIQCIRSGLRKHLGGFDIGLTHLDFAIAETGTCVLSSENEDVRIASMLCEYHVAIMYASDIVANSYEAEERLNSLMQGDKPHYTAFISGPSRTADIERVLALGAHGPLELHLIIVDHDHAPVA